ncbi:MAG: hypothetical protein IJ035_06570 [Oscillospiraceae bacterium]|nr:hypothetical protein [Oscillospiraceae bacterium]
MKNVKELKQSITPRMKRCWGECCALFFISAGGLTAALFAGYLVMNFLVTMEMARNMNDPLVIAVVAVIFLLMWIITVPYKYGIRWYRLQQVRGHSVHAKSVFSCYFSTKRMLQVYKLSILLFIKRCVLLFPLAVFLGTSIFLIIRINEDGGSIADNLAVAGLLALSAVIYLAYMIINIKYAAAPYIFALGHDRPAIEIIKESTRFMKDKQVYMIEMLRSCAMMLIPCIFVFPAVFVLPRMMMLYTAAINEIIENGFAEDRLAVGERRG